MAAEFAGAGAEVEQMVGGADDVGVVLDDEDGVAEVAERVHDADELGGVAGVQADGGLVEHVECADETRAERGGELDALRFAAGERGGEAVEREVVEADLVEEVDALADFFEDFAGDFLLRRRELQIVEEVCAAVMVRAEASQMFLVRVTESGRWRADGAGFGAEALAAAVGADGVAAIFGEEDADVELVLLALERCEEAADAGHELGPDPRPS